MNVTTYPTIKRSRRFIMRSMPLQMYARLSGAVCVLGSATPTVVQRHQADSPLLLGEAAERCEGEVQAAGITSPHF